MIILAFLLISSVSAAADLSAKDVIGSSETCKVARSEIAPNTNKCTVKNLDIQQKTKAAAESIEFKAASNKESALAANEIKQRLIQNAVANFAQSVTQAKKMTGQDPFARPQIRQAESEMIEACGSGESHYSKDINNLLKNAKSSPAAKNTDPAELKRYATAMLEYDRLNLAINDNYVRGAEKTRMLQRRQNILIHYPMLKNTSHQSLQQILALELNLRGSLLGSNSGAPAADQDWMDGYLFENKNPPATAATDSKKDSKPLSYQVAVATTLAPLSARAETEVANDFVLNTKASLESLKNLCRADACTTFNISHEITALSLRKRSTIQNIQDNFRPPGEPDPADKRKFDLLLKSVCDCKMLEPTHFVDEKTSTRLTLVSFGALAVCIADIALPNPTMVTCPATAAAFWAATAASTGNLVYAAGDSLRTSNATEISKNLPGLNSDEKQKLTDFQKARETQVAEDIALTAVAVPATGLAIQGAKVGFKKVKETIKAAKAAKQNKNSKAPPAPTARKTDPQAKPSGQGGAAGADGSPVGSRSPQRQSFINAYADKSVTSEAQRQSFLDYHNQILNGKAVGAVKSTENSVMKHINTHLNDMRMADALNNLRNEILANKLTAYLKNNPALKLEIAHDFKGLHTIAHGKVPKSFDADYSKMERETMSELYDYTIKNSLVRPEDIQLIKNMNNTGAGSDFDQSTAMRKLDTKLTPDRDRPKEVRSFTDGSSTEALKDRLDYTEYYRKQIQESIGGTPLMQTVEGTNKQTLNREVYAILKKSDDPKKLKEDLLRRYPDTPIDEKTIRQMKEYQLLVEDQSPGLLPKVRTEKATLEEAQFGGISSDTKGMGGYNTEATAKGAARAKDVPSSLKEVRAEEQKVTQWLTEDVNPNYKAVAKDTFNTNNAPISGDEKKIIFEKKETLNSLKTFVRAHAAKDPTLQRHSYIPPGVPKNMRDPLSEHGHGIDKALDENLKKILPTEKTSSMNSMIMMETKSVNKGTVSIIIGQKPGAPKLNKDDVQEIKKAFKQALKKFNPPVGDKPETFYEMGTIHLADK